MLWVDHVQPFTVMLFHADSGLFQQQNAPCHKSAMVQEWFKKLNSEFKVLTWPPNSLDLADLNPIEHLLGTFWTNKCDPWRYHLGPTLETCRT